MNKIEVLVATMDQNNLSKYKKMNIQTNVIFANQADRYEYIEELIHGNMIKMVTTTQRGVGKNRNTALLYSSADICMLSDDDVVYVDGYEKGVVEAFEKLTDADIIVFNVDSLNKNRTETRRIKRIGRVRIYNFIRYGAINIAFRRESWVKKNIWFTLLFGGGTTYSCGEDSLFLREALKQGLKVYSYPYKIADVRQDISTWFNGFNEKYFYDHGAWLAAAFPILKYLGVIYYMYKFKKLSELSCIKILGLMINGMNGFRNGVSYGEWKEKAVNSK